MGLNANKGQNLQFYLDQFFLKYDSEADPLELTPIRDWCHLKLTPDPSHPNRCYMISANGYGDYRFTLGPERVGMPEEILSDKALELGIVSRGFGGAGYAKKN